ncbi:hypothetical protein NL529_30050, partial [Klebsiella pneumoniae]|nr:hypothetical protein [Klebsiella pneumoniae]
VASEPGTQEAEEDESSSESETSLSPVSAEGQVLYSAPDAPETEPSSELEPPEADEDEDADEDDDDDDLEAGDVEEIVMESHWRNGVP